MHKPISHIPSIFGTFIPSQGPRRAPIKMNSLLPNLYSSMVGPSRNWLLITLIISLPLFTEQVSFYFGANENMLDNFKNIADRTEQLNQEDLKSVYTFCNVLPLLEKMGRVPENKDSQKICSQLMVLLDPMFGDKKLPVKRRRITSNSRLFHDQTKANRKNSDF